jgi:hypothetical protein
MAKKKQQAESQENASLTTFHKKPQEALKQITAFLDSVDDKKHFSIECFTTDEGFQVTVSQHNSK